MIKGDLFGLVLIQQIVELYYVGVAFSELVGSAVTADNYVSLHL